MAFEVALKVEASDGESDQVMFDTEEMRDGRLTRGSLRNGRKMDEGVDRDFR